VQPRFRTSHRFLILLTATVSVGFAQEIPVHEKFAPTLWVQTSIEWEGPCRQAYQQARAALDFALKKNKKCTAPDCLDTPLFMLQSLESTRGGLGLGSGTPIFQPATAGCTW